MQVIERALLRALFQIPEALRFEGEPLDLRFDREALLLHLDKILAAKLRVVPDAADFEALGPALLEPAHDVRVVCHLVVRHVEPAVFLPAKERYLVLRRFHDGSRPRKPAVRDDDVHALVVPEEAAGRQVVHLGKIRAAVPADGELRELLDRPVVLFV